MPPPSSPDPPSVRKGLPRQARFVATAARALSLIALLLGARSAAARNLLSADGPGGTYELIRGAYTTELPDCGHMVPHITEEMDGELRKNVFIFHAHINEDDDRCSATDRQRTEIRARAADIVANNGETVHYRWKFKLPDGFKTASSFTHIFQIKSDEGAPVMTLTPRTTSLSIDGRVGVRGTTALAKFIGVWVVVDLEILYGNAGHIDMSIRRISNGETLLQHSGAADTWDDNASAHDIKFGIYRSLSNRGSLRDEQVRFADFCASKQSAAECDDGAVPPPQPPPGVGDGSVPPDPPDAADAAPPPGSPDAGMVTAPGEDAGSAPPPPPAPTPPPPPGESPGSTPDPRPSPAPSPPPAAPVPVPAGGSPSGGSGCHFVPATSPSPRWPLGLVLLAVCLGLLRRRRRCAEGGRPGPGLESSYGDVPEGSSITRRCQD